MSTPAVKPTRQQLDELDALLQKMLSLPSNQVDANLPPPPPPPPPMPAPEPPQMVYAPPPPPPQPAARPAPPPMAARRAGPPTGDNAWNIALPANAGGAAFSGWPVGIEALTHGAPSAVVPRSVPLGKLNVTPIPAPQPVKAPEAPPPVAPRPRPMPMPANMPPPGMSPAVIMQAPPAPPPPLPLPMPMHAALPFYLWPLGLLDSSLGGGLASFGPIGRWLGQGSGKVLIGWAGLIMMAGAAAWGVMDYMGWSW